MQGCTAEEDANSKANGADDTSVLLSLHPVDVICFAALLNSLLDSLHALSLVKTVKYGKNWLWSSPIFKLVLKISAFLFCYPGKAL